METEIISCGGGFDFACLRKVLPTLWNTHTHTQRHRHRHRHGYRHGHRHRDFCLILNTVIELFLKLK